MKVNPRTRQTIKWSAAALAVLVFMIWMFGIVGHAGYMASDGRYARLFDGSVEICRRSPPEISPASIHSGGRWDYSMARPI